MPRKSTSKPSRRNEAGEWVFTAEELAEFEEIATWPLIEIDYEMQLLPPRARAARSTQTNNRPKNG